MFSSAVKVSDLNDYLTPAEDCVKPILDSITKDEPTSTPNTSTVAPKTAKPSPIRPDLIKEKEGEKAQVNLIDCLACSGCVTTSEVVLIEQQGAQEFMKQAKTIPFTTVSISPQSCAALAQHHNISYISAMKKLSTLFRKFGVARVYDMSLADSIALLCAYQDFAARINQEKAPMYTSHCPGFVVYAEKTLLQASVDRICSTMPAQEIQGLLVKILGAREFNRKNVISLAKQTFNPGAFTDARKLLWKKDRFGGSSANESKTPLVVDVAKDTFHVVVQPCYDKKLESVRESYRQVKFEKLISQKKDNSEDEEEEAGALADLVLATSEIEELIQHLGLDSFTDLPETEVDFLTFDTESQDTAKDDCFFSCVEPLLARADGGFADFLIKKAYSDGLIPRKKGDQAEIEWKVGRNKHIQEGYVDGVLRVVRATGFRNIQNAVVAHEKRKTGAKDDLLLVEVLACPGGCLNGIGQVLGGAQTASGSRVLLPEEMQAREEGMLNKLSERRYEETLDAGILARLERLLESNVEGATDRSEGGAELSKCLVTAYTSLKGDGETKMGPTASDLKW